MKPIRTAETTHELQPAPGDEERVSPLPSFVEDGAIVSIWEPDEDDMRIGATVRYGVRLEVLGDCPPIRLSIVTLHETPMALGRSVLVDETGG